MATVIQVKRGTAAAWTSANTVLTAGEIGFESDTKKMKVGDGSTAWTSLAYTATDGDITAVVAGTGLSGGSTSGSATLSIDTATTVDKTTAQTLTNKTLTSPVLTTPSISTMTTTGDILYASSANTPARLGIGSTDQILKVSGGVPVWGSASASAFAGCSAGGLTTLSNGGTTYSLVMTSENFDTDAFHDNSTNNTRFTIPSGKGGKYQVNVRVGFDSATGSPGGHMVHVRVNGTGTYSFATTSIMTISASSGSNTIAVGSQILSLAAADYIEVLARTDNGNGNVNATVMLSIAYLGA